jgi:pyrroline-5-carboxylate reductase
MGNIAFIGSGRMASAMVAGLLRSHAYIPNQIACIGGAGTSSLLLSQQTGIRLATSAIDLFMDADAVIVACKPQQFADLDREYGIKSAGKLIISILAGVRLEKLSTFFPQARAIVRTVPNTPGAIGKGVTVWSASSALALKDNDLLSALLDGLGESLELPEEQLDAVTAISGSGPGFFFEFLAAYEAAARNLGLSPNVVRRLVRETFKGSLALVESTNEKPESLRDQVTSPNGTTRAGLDALDKAHLRDAIATALIAARDRSRELSR